jgi:hypothetical protein
LKKGKDKNQFLAGHKKVGKKLIPPIMQLKNIVPTSFQDETLPDLIWLSAVFSNYGDREAIEKLSTFLRHCKELFNDEELPCLVYLSNFSKLNDQHKSAIRAMAKTTGQLSWIQTALLHQAGLLRNYPLDFLFHEGFEFEARAVSIKSLKGDVSSLLDRYSIFATKVQVTAVYLMMITGKLFVSKEIEMPDFDVVINAPESDSAKRAASFVRATLNGGIPLREMGDDKNTWPADFWRQAFNLEGCS